MEHPLHRSELHAWLADVCKWYENEDSRVPPKHDALLDALKSSDSEFSWSRRCEREFRLLTGESGVQYSRETYGPWRTKNPPLSTFEVYLLAHLDEGEACASNSEGGEAYVFPTPGFDGGNKSPGGASVSKSCSFFFETARSSFETASGASVGGSQPVEVESGASAECEGAGSWGESVHTQYVVEYSATTAESDEVSHSGASLQAQRRSFNDDDCGDSCSHQCDSWCWCNSSPRIASRYS